MARLDARLIPEPDPTPPPPPERVWTMTLTDDELASVMLSLWASKEGGPRGAQRELMARTFHSLNGSDFPLSAVTPEIEVGKVSGKPVYSIYGWARRRMGN